MDISQTSFLFMLSDGYTLRNSFMIMKGEIDVTTMILSPTGIEISFVNENKCGVHDVVLHASEFSMYRYDFRDEEGNLLPEYPVSFSIDEMFNTTKNIGRKDGVRMYLLKDDDKINVQPIKTTTKDPGRAGAMFVNLVNVEYNRHQVPGTYPTEANVKVQSKDISEIFSQASTLKCNCVQIDGKNSSVIIKSVLPNKTLAAVNKFVSQTSVILPKAVDTSAVEHLISSASLVKSESKFKLNIKSPDDIISVIVPISTIKSLSKIHNISASGTMLRFYFTAGRPVKLESPIGMYGTYTIWLRNSKV